MIHRGKGMVPAPTKKGINWKMKLQNYPWIKQVYCHKWWRNNHFLFPINLSKIHFLSKKLFLWLYMCFKIFIKCLWKIGISTLFLWKIKCFHKGPIIIKQTNLCPSCKFWILYQIVLITMWYVYVGRTLVCVFVCACLCCRK